jgi:uncharacterized protein YdeI (YjbR/CyaY-like superfamily)
MNDVTQKIGALIAKSDWRDELAALRNVVLGCGLSEDVKWGQPCYTAQGRNVVIIHGFKDYCALLFFKGALMQDPHNLLVRQTDNVQGARQIRFASMNDIAGREDVLAAYIRDAVAVETSGAKVEKAGETPVPEEFQARLDDSPDLQAAFAKLTPGRRRAYLLHFAAAKQVKTREARIDKHLAAILAGKGLDD